MSLQVWLPLMDNLDNQGLNNAVQATGDAVSTAGGKIGKCYSFNGTSQYLSLSNLNLSGLSGVSVAFWCKVPTQLDCVYQIKSSSVVTFQLYGNSYYFRDSRHNSLVGVSIDPAPVNTWTHYAIIFDRGNWLLYKNGELQTNGCFPASQTAAFYSNSKIFYIGRRNVTAGDTFFEGKLNDFRIYDHALSPKEVKEISKGLVLHYKLDSIYYNPIVPDCSGYLRDGTVVGTMTAAAGSPRYSSGIYMNNTNTANHIETNADIDFDRDDLTVCFWVKMAKTPGKVLCIMPDLQCCINNSGNAFYISSTSHLGYSASTFTANQWNFLTIVRTNGDYKFYINGTEITASASATNWTHNSNKLYLLNRSYNNSYAAEAYVSDFRIYTTVLTPQEIQELYNVSMSIDSSGNIYARELVESDGS